MPENQKDQSFLLGKIEATVSGTADDVKALRFTMETQAVRLTDLEHEITAIKTDRDAMKPEYFKLVHKVNNHLQADSIWKSRFEGKRDGLTLSGKIAWVVVAALLIPLFLTYVKPMIEPKHHTAVGTSLQTGPNS